MSAGAIGMFLFGAILLWGGMAVTIAIAINKNKNKSS